MALGHLIRISVKITKNRILDFPLYGRWEDLGRWKWVVIDVGVILDTSATHSENLLFSSFWGPLGLPSPPPPIPQYPTPRCPAARPAGGGVQVHIFICVSYFAEKVNLLPFRTMPFAICRKTSGKKTSQNGLREYPELLPHQLRLISTYTNPPVSHIGKKLKLLNVC